MLPQTAVEDPRVMSGTGQSGHAPSEPTDGGAKPTPLSETFSERMTLGEPLEEGQPEEIALPFVDADGEMIVEGVAERMADEEGPATMNPQGIDRSLADGLTGHHLGRDRLELAPHAPRGVD